MEHRYNTSYLIAVSHDNYEIWSAVVTHLTIATVDHEVDLIFFRTPNFPPLVLYHTWYHISHVFDCIETLDLRYDFVVLVHAFRVVLLCSAV